MIQPYLHWQPEIAALAFIADSADIIGRVSIGNDVTIGHRVILHGCDIQDGSLVGMGSIIMDQAVLEAGCLLAAGSLITERKILRGGYLYAGSPATQRRELSDKEKVFLQRSANHYVDIASNHKHA